MIDFKGKIRNIPDFPRKGVVFRDISPLLEDKDCYKEAVDRLVDDVLATGGSMAAALKLVKRLGGKVVKIVFLIILDYLPGRKVLGEYTVISLIDYPK